MYHVAGVVLASRSAGVCHCFSFVNACIHMIRGALLLSLFSPSICAEITRPDTRGERRERGRSDARRGARARGARRDASREGETLIELSLMTKNTRIEISSTSQSTYCRRLPTRVVHACQQSGHSGARGAPRLYTQALEAAGPDTRPQLITQRERRPPATAGPGPCMSSSLSSSESSSSPGAARHQLKAIEELGPAAGCEVAEAAE